MDANNIPEEDELKPEYNTSWKLKARVFKGEIMREIVSSPKNVIRITHWTALTPDAQKIYESRTWRLINRTIADDILEEIYQFKNKRGFMVVQFKYLQGDRYWAQKVYRYEYPRKKRRTKKEIEEARRAESLEGP